MSKEKITILGHQNPDIDSIVSGLLVEYFINNHTSYQGEFIIPDSNLDKTTISICQEYHIPYLNHQKEIPIDSKALILVDHNEREIEDKEIIAIFDHHPTTKKPTVPIYINKKISSTAALLVKGNEKYFPKELLELAILASYVDTASFNSTKARKEDQEWAESLTKKLGFNQKKLYETGLALTDLSNLEEAAFECLKKYQMANKNVEVSSIQINNLESHQNELVKIKEIVLEYFLKKDLDVYILIIHDMDKMQSTAYKIFKDGIEADNYDKYTSRGNVIIPKLEKEINNHTFSSNLVKEKRKTINE